MQTRRAELVSLVTCPTVRYHPVIVAQKAATATVRPDDLAETIPCGPDPDRFADAIGQWVDAGFDHVAVAPVGDIDAFLAMWEGGLRDRLR